MDVLHDFFFVHNKLNQGYEINITYRYFVLAKKNSISTQFPGVTFGQSCNDQLDSFVGLVQVGRQLISHHLVVSSDHTDPDGKGRRSCSAKVFVL